MWRIVFIFFSILCLGAAPSRDNSYVAGTVINPVKVTANEDTIYTYLQNGVDTYKPGSVDTTALQNNAVTSAKILDGTITTADLAFSIGGSGVNLPSGAIFFMITGSCPSGTTDVSATYANLFIRVNSTPGSTGGANSHTHAAGSYVGSVHTHSTPAHSHSVPRDNWGATDVGISGRIATAENAGAGNALATATNDNTTATDGAGTTGSGGGGAITGTSASSDNIPSFITARLCKVT